MTKTGGNIDEINKYLMMQTGLALNDINALYLKVAKDIYKDVSYLYKAGNVEQPKFKDNNRLQTYIASVQKLTQNTFINMANTTVINKTYRDTIDFAVDAVSRGVGDYDTAIKNMEKPLFGCFKVPLANNVDMSSPLGISIFSPAIKMIELADKQFSRLDIPNAS